MHRVDGGKFVGMPRGGGDGNEDGDGDEGARSPLLGSGNGRRNGS